MPSNTPQDRTPKPHDPSAPPSATAPNDGPSPPTAPVHTPKPDPAPTNNEPTVEAGEAVRGEAVRGEAVRGEAVRGEAVRGEPVRGEPVRGEPVRGEPVRGGEESGLSDERVGRAGPASGAGQGRVVGGGVGERVRAEGRARHGVGVGGGGGVRRLLGRGVLYGVGVVFIGIGVHGILSDPRNAPLGGWGKWFLGGVLIHDLLFAPVVLLVAALVVRIPLPYRRIVQAALVVGGSLTLVALPAVLGYGRRPDNPSQLPLPYGRNLVELLVAIAVVAAAIAAVSFGVAIRDSVRKRR